MKKKKIEKNPTKVTLDIASITILIFKFETRARAAETEPTWS